ncbi:uncharacterized protein PV09_05404 [Verruconis gallopava]|uniref:Uncharacterized protein n=1 Tax=Verruconis gallopava TaxID=253628 RepID=A0A0D1YRE7_9PEZI|nr:uncharacterized protein PV09_05404 [Verruconis gallopava]KIW03177.1 hypothetical protein PV09_05404 [Verruconis gallopava]
MPSLLIKLQRHLTFSPTTASFDSGQLSSASHCPALADLQPFWTGRLSCSKITLLLLVFFFVLSLNPDTMTSLFPRSEYAEDQQYAKTILRFHCWLRGLTTGAIVAVPTAAASTLIWGPTSLPVFNNRLLVHSFRGTVAGLVFGAVAVEGRMFGRSDIEWKDRSYRLLANKGQIEVDNWTLIGGAIGGLLGARRGLIPLSLSQRVLAGVGLGNVGGTLGYVGWRYGVNGGKWPEDK